MPSGQIPIAYNTARSSLFDNVANYVVCQPHGIIVAADREGRNMPFYNESEAVEWSKREIAE